MKRPIIQFTLNNPQAKLQIVMANETWYVASRASGKTFGGTAPWILHKVEVMPRSSGALAGTSFADLKSKILKPLFEAFEAMGHTLDVHYTYGKEPPKTWKRPYIPIIDWTHVVSWPNGTTMQLISLHLVGSANSNSFQWCCMPEVKYAKQEQLRTEILPTLRGNVKHFGDSPWYGATMWETDKYSPNIHWILAKKKLNDEKKIATVIFYQLEVNQLRQQLLTVEERQAYRIVKRIDKITAVLNALRRNLVLYLESNALDNIVNLKPGYLENMKRGMTDYEYRVSILNEDPTKVEDGFYPDRTEEHLYHANNDDDITRPLAVAMDWQAMLTPLVSCQLSANVIKGVTTLNFLHSIFVKHPLGIPDVIKMFCTLHKYRPCKTVMLYYDHTAVAERNNAKSYYMEAVSAFVKNDWEVIKVPLGQAPFHDLKYNRINAMFRGEYEYQVRFNMEGCKTLLLSMDNTEIKKGSAYQKDKSKEKDKDYPQELATHFPDTFDVLAWGILEQKKYPENSSNDTVMVGIR